MNSSELQNILNVPFITERQKEEMIIQVQVITNTIHLPCVSVPLQIFRLTTKQAKTTHVCLALSCSATGCLLSDSPHSHVQKF